MNNQPAPEGFLRLSSKWLETNPLPKRVRYKMKRPSGKWYPYAGPRVQGPGNLRSFDYCTDETDLPMEAYADDEIRPMTAEERKALDEFTMKELTETEPAPDLTQPGLPKADLTQPEVASERAEEYIEPKTVREAQIHCQLKVEVNTLRAQLEAKEGECREFRGIVHQLDRRDALAGFKTVGDKISALLKIAAAADPKAELAKSIMENDNLRAELQQAREGRAAQESELTKALAAYEDQVQSLEAERDKLRAEVEELKADRERLDWLENPLRFTLEQSVELRVLNPDDKGNYFEFSIREVMPLDEFYACLTLRSAIDAARAATEEGK